MPNPFGYRFVIAAEVFRYVFSLRVTERQFLDDIFQFLAENPHFRGDYQEPDEDERPRTVFLRGRFLVTFWADDAAKEIRVVRVEKIRPGG